MNPITIENVGPVRHLEIRPPEGGGIIVLKGRNGRGKTETLAAVEAATSGRTKGLSVTDGQKGGRVEAFGVSIKLGRANRRTGELEVETLEGKLNVADLVDPGIKSAEAADARRIKALVHLSGAQPDVSLFRSILDSSEFDELIGTSAREADDLVLMAERITRDLHAAARKREGQAETAATSAKVAHESAEGVDVEQPDDADALQVRVEEAIQAESSLKQRAESAEQAALEQERVLARIDELEVAAAVTPASARQVVEHRQGTLEERQAEYDYAVKALQEARERMESATVERDKAKDKLESAETVLEQAEEHARTIDELRSRLASGIPAPPTARELAEATDGVLTARQAVETGVLVRRAKQQAAAARDFAEEAAHHRKAAESLREAAKLTDEVLSDLVAKNGSPLRVEAGRLVLDTKRGVTYFAELSHGERWKLALDIAIEAVGEGGVFTVVQDAWESLDPIARREIAEHVAGRGVTVLTAEASEDEEIRAEEFAA